MCIAAMASFLLLLLATAVGVGAADLRAVYLERNGKDMRIEMLTAQWLGRNGMAEELVIPAGNPIQWRDSLTTLEDTTYTLPLDLTVRFGTVEGMQARLGRLGNGGCERFLPPADCGRPLGPRACLERFPSHH